ncbi:phenylethanolamine N-methyltransferase [Xenopus laevis]|uniref:Phenylethanolamine N-methyltransferase n=2 Tax=Xenopus laevis TaxID=8355 RepID=A0A1L8ERY1_XENLA|nr:phenylethanolamine N-methyltransferase [Xenopus laevis]OCT62081.1 hypothetical protein XELAEV_18043165mg [Xenopus laevis]
MSNIESVAQSYQHFNPRAYLQNNYVPPRADFSNEDSVVQWKLRCLADTCATGEIAGQTLVDIGSGPTIYQILSASEHFAEVVLTDYLEVNRAELRRWLQDEPGAFDWSPYMKHVSKLERTGGTWQEKQQRIRERVKKVLPVDVHQSNPLGEEMGTASVDTLVTTFCLEACSPNLQMFNKALGNITSLLKPGGHLLFIGALEESYYLAGEAKLNVVPVTEEIVRNALSDASYKIKEFKTYVMPPALKVGVDDVNGVFFAWAQKQDSQ